MPNLDSPRDVIYVLADRWFSLKTLLEVGLHANDIALHLAAGVALQFLFALLLRLRASSVGLWLLVLAIQVANEVSDLHWGGMKGEGSLAASALDTAVTMLLPSAFLLMARWRMLGRERQGPGDTGQSIFRPQP